jgi:hypothetical protein
LIHQAREDTLRLPVRHRRIIPAEAGIQV